MQEGALSLTSDKVIVTVVVLEKGVTGSLSVAVTVNVSCCMASISKFSETKMPPVSELMRKNEVPLSEYVT